MSTEGKIEDFVIFPRQAIRDLRNGTITPNEFVLFCYIRLSGNPYGVAVTSLENIHNDILKDVSMNYCNKILLDLKSKRYIYYKSRTGRRGSFEVHLGDWKLPNKSIKTLDQFFNNEDVRGLSSAWPPPKSEDSQNLTPVSQSFESQKNDLLTAFSFDSLSTPLRGANNDTDIEKDIYKNDNRSDISFLSLEEFIPNSSEESVCLEIATYLKEKHVNPILALRNTYGMSVIEKAFGIVREDFRTKRIRNKGAYFQKVAENIGNYTM